MRLQWRLIGFLILMASGSRLFAQQIGIVGPTELWATDPSSACAPYNTLAVSAATGNVFICNAGTWARVGAGSMVYPGPGIANSTGSAWGTSYSAGTGINNLFQLGGGGWGGVCGGSGALTCATAGQIDIVTAVVPRLAEANSWSGLNTFSKIAMPGSTIATLPSASSVPNQWFVATDGASTCDTTTGGGSIPVLVQSNGTAYIAPNCTTKRAIGYSFDGGGSALSGTRTGYVTVPFACTITAWNMTLGPSGTATVDVWKIASGTAVPTVANTITASATPAIPSGTALHSAALTGWTTAVSANDIVGFNLSAVSTATSVQLVLECDQ